MTGCPLSPSKCWTKSSCLSKCSRSSQIEIVDLVKAKSIRHLQNLRLPQKKSELGIPYQLLPSLATTFFAISTHFFYSLGRFVVFSSIFMKYETHHWVWNSFLLSSTPTSSSSSSRVFVTLENWQYNSTVVCNCVWPLFAKHTSFSGWPLSV